MSVLLTSRVRLATWAIWVNAPQPGDRLTRALDAGRPRHDTWYT
jgi:hypothetical protein